MDWARNDEVVAEGRWHSRDPKVLVNGLPLGPNEVKIYVDEVLSPLAFLWRPTTEMTNMEDTLHSFVAWPANRVVEFETPTEASAQKSPQTPKSPRNSAMNSSAGPTSSIQKSTQTPKSNTENFTKTSTAGPSSALDKSPQTPKSSKTNSKAVTSPAAQRSPTLKAPRKTKIVPQSPLRKSKWNVVKENQKCKLMDLGGKQRVVAEGRWASNDPNQRVHFVPLGPNAVRVWVDVVKIKSAAVWRTSDEIETMEDCLGTSIAWPEDKVVLC